MIAWNFQKIVGTCQFRVPWFGYPCCYSSLTKKSSTIFCSQYVFEEWYDQLGGEASPLADAIIDRIAHDSYQINITSIDAEHDKSMREVYGLDKTLHE